MRDFDEIYKSYANTLYRYILKLSHNETVAEEIVQQTFYKAVKNSDKFKGECKILTWLCQIAKNEYLNHIRKKDNGHLNIDDFTSVSSGYDYEKLAEDKETAAAVRTALAELPKEYREVFELRVFEDMSFAEISCISERTENWARVTFFRARQKIIRKLEEQGYEM